MTEAEARDAIEALDLEFARGPDVSVDFEDSRNLQAASQDPAAGEIVAAFSTVTVSFYQQEEATVPDIFDVFPLTAQDRLTAAGLTWVEGECITTSSEYWQKVVWQSEDPGTIVDPNIPIEYWIARETGPSEVCPV
jgi:beta-lactam-binding protein with PASTA domain